MENVAITDTPEEFREMCGVIVPKLFGLLKELCALEEETNRRADEIDEENEQNGIPDSEATDEEEALWEEYEERYRALCEGRCTEAQLENELGKSFGSPAAYSYLNGEYTAEFTMKKPDEAAVITYFKYGVDKKHKFVMKLVGGEWLVDEVFEGFSDEKKLYPACI